MTQHQLSAEAHEQQKSDAEAQRLAAERAAYYVLHGGPAPAGFVLPVLGRAVEWPAEAPARASAPTPDEPATLKLGVICQRLELTMTAYFVSERLGVKPATIDGRAVLFR